MSDAEIRFFAEMVRIRRFEEMAVDLYKEGLVGGSYHSYVGQEAVAVGVCSALAREDTITTTYRGRGQHLAKGASAYRLFAELLGRVDGYCKGKGGPMHICDLETGILGANGIVAGGISHSVGAALTAQMSGSRQVAVAFFGDGAVNQGVFSEAMNLAALWDLPMIFVCENNLYAEMTPLSSYVKNARLVDRAAAFGMVGEVVDGNDVAAVFRAVQSARTRALDGQGPTFLEMMTYRLHGHMLGDPETYRSKEEVAEWRARDPIVRWKTHLLESGLATEGRLAELEQTLDAELASAAERARASLEPGPEAILEDVL